MLRDLIQKRSVSAAIPAFATGRRSSDALLTGLVRWCFVPGREHSTEESGSAAVGDDNDISSGHFVVPSLMLCIEDDPDDSDAEGYRGDEATDDFARDGDGDAWFVAFVVDDGDTGDPFAKRASEEAGRDDEVSEKDEYVDDSGLRAKYATTGDRSDHEDDHQENTDVDGEGVEAAKGTGEF